MKKNNIKRLIVLTLSSLLAFIAGCALTAKSSEVPQHLPYNTELIVAYNDYYNHCEALLDSIVVWDETFLDTTMETDAYYDYEVSRERVDSLLTLEP